VYTGVSHSNTFFVFLEHTPSNIPWTCSWN